MGKSYVNRNMQAFKTGLENFIAQLNVRLIRVGTDSAQEVMDYIDSMAGDDFPHWTSNMYDGTGVGVYSNGALMRYENRGRTANKSQHMGRSGGLRIWGDSYLSNAISRGVTNYADGTWVVLISAVPYAEIINSDGSKWDRGQGFFDKLSAHFASTVETTLKVEFPKAKIR